MRPETDSPAAPEIDRTGPSPWHDSVRPVGMRRYQLSSPVQEMAQPSVPADTDTDTDTDTAVAAVVGPSGFRRQRRPPLHRHVPVLECPGDPHRPAHLVRPRPAVVAPGERRVLRG